MQGFPYKKGKGQWSLNEIGPGVAISKDGLHWERPSLRNVELQGSKQNNRFFVVDPKLFSLQDCVAVETDGIRHVVSWKSNADIRSLAGKQVRLLHGSCVCRRKLQFKGQNDHCLLILRVESENIRRLADE